MSEGDLHESSVEIGKLISVMDAMRGEVSGMRKDLGRMESEIKSLTEFKTQGKTSLLAVSLAAGGMGAAIKIFWDYLKGQWV